MTGQRTAIQRPSEKDGDAFVAYHTGFTWLKMPTPDAQRFATILLDTDFRDKITRRWEQSSWRMHIPVVFDEGPGIVPASTAQIHFPREQVAKLTLTLERIGR